MKTARFCFSLTLLFPLYPSLALTLTIIAKFFLPDSRELCAEQQQNWGFNQKILIHQLKLCSPAICIEFSNYQSNFHSARIPMQLIPIIARGLCKVPAAVFCS